MKRSGPIQRRTPIKRRSTKARSLDSARRACRIVVFERSAGRCEVCPRLDPGAPPHEAVDVHEIVMRSSGGDITDPENCLAACRRGHRMIHDYPKRATELGLLARNDGGRP